MTCWNLCQNMAISEEKKTKKHFKTSSTYGDFDAFLTKILCMSLTGFVFGLQVTEDLPQRKKNPAMNLANISLEAKTNYWENHVSGWLPNHPNLKDQMTDQQCCSSLDSSYNSHQTTLLFTTSNSVNYWVKQKRVCWPFQCCQWTNKDPKCNVVS